jgi:hypothetical protein
MDLVQHNFLSLGMWWFGAQSYQLLTCMSKEQGQPSQPMYMWHHGTGRELEISPSRLSTKIYVRVFLVR